MLICPKPTVWNTVFQKLNLYAQDRSCAPPLPPTPLILNGWVFTNDLDKLQAWERTIEWAQRNGCAYLIAAIPLSDFYTVEAPDIDPYPLYLERNIEPRPKADKLVLARLIEELRGRWIEIVEEEISHATTPTAFTGKKGRRLLVRADATIQPPWGTWTKRAGDWRKRYRSEEDEEGRRTFTLFRASINRDIAPHHVDHIDFLVDCHWTARYAQEFG